MTFWDHCNNSNKWKYLSFLPVTQTQILFKLAWLVVYSLIEIMWLFCHTVITFFLYKFTDPGLKQWHSMYLEENPNSYHGLKDSRHGHGQPLTLSVIIRVLIDRGRQKFGKKRRWCGQRLKWCSPSLKTEEGAISQGIQLAKRGWIRRGNTFSPQRLQKKPDLAQWNWFWTSDLRNSKRINLCCSWTVAHQAPLSMEFSRQEHRSG